MTAKPKRDERGQFMPKWAAQLQEKVCELDFFVNGRESIGPHDDPPLVGLVDEVDEIKRRLSDLSDRLGTSTPLIIWNIAVLVAIAMLTAKVYGVAPY